MNAAQWQPRPSTSFCIGDHPWHHWNVSMNLHHAWLSSPHVPRFCQLCIAHGANWGQLSFPPLMKRKLKIWLTIQDALGKDKSQYPHAPLLSIPLLGFSLLCPRTLSSGYSWSPLNVPVARLEEKQSSSPRKKKGGYTVAISASLSHTGALREAGAPIPSHPLPSLRWKGGCACLIV